MSQFKKIYEVTNEQATNIMILINKHQKLCKTDAVFNLQYLDKRTQKKLQKLMLKDNLTNLLIKTTELKHDYKIQFKALERIEAIIQIERETKHILSNKKEIAKNCTTKQRKRLISLIHISELIIKDAKKILNEYRQL